MSNRKRVLLNRDNLSEVVRAAMVANARYYTNGAAGRQKGDPVFEDVTEGRQTWWMHNGKRRDYSACGDLCHKCLWELVGGHHFDSRDESGMQAVARKIINRKEAWGYRIGKNVSMLRWNPHFRVFKRKAADMRPGDILLIGENGREHVCVVESRTERGYTSYDYGQYWDGAHGGRHKVNTVSLRSDGRFYNRDRALIGVLDPVSMVEAMMGAARTVAFPPVRVPSDFPLSTAEAIGYFEDEQ